MLNSWEPVLTGSCLLAANDLFVIYISMSGKYGLIALTEYCWGGEYSKDNLVVLHQGLKKKSHVLMTSSQIQQD